MDLAVHEKRSAHFFAGCGGDVCGMKLSGWLATFAVEINRHRCRTLRLNHPELIVYQGPIERMILEDYPRKGRILAFFVTFPCDHYTLVANVHETWTGDSLYLEALREIVLYNPEWVALENVYGIKKFKRVMQTFQELPDYYCTEFLLHGEEFTLQRKKRVFLVLHRQPYEFQELKAYRLPRQRNLKLKDYLDLDSPIPRIPNYVYTRLDGKKYRDPPKIYDPEQESPVNLFTNIGRDRSLFLVRDKRAPRGVRPFHVREVANLHGFPRSYRFVGPLGECYDMVVDCVMPEMAYVLGKAANDYFAAIANLAPVKRPLGYREVLSERQAQREEVEALLADLLQEDSEASQQLTLWNEPW